MCHASFLFPLYVGSTLLFHTANYSMSPTAVWVKYPFGNCTNLQGLDAWGYLFWVEHGINLQTSCVFIFFFTLRDYVNYLFFSPSSCIVSNFLILMICWLWMFLIVARLTCPASYQKYLSFLILYYYLVYHLQLEMTYERSRKNLCG